MARPTAVAIDMRLEGLTDLSRAFGALNEGLQGRALRDAAFGAAEVIRARAEELAPASGQKKKISAVLHRNIIKVVVKQEPTECLVKIGPSRGVPHAHLVEFGTKPHTIEAGQRRGSPTRARILANPVHEDLVFGRLVRHPGARAHPFLRPAIDQKGAEAQARFGELLGKTVERLAAKYATRAR